MPTLKVKNNNTWTEIATAGAPGNDGKSAYQCAVEGGYTGTEVEFNAILANAATKEYVDGINALPASTTSDNGKFLRVVNGAASWQTVQNAEEVSV